MHFRPQLHRQVEQVRVFLAESELAENVADQLLRVRVCVDEQRLVVRVRADRVREHLDRALKHLFFIITFTFYYSISNFIIIKCYIKRSRSKQHFSPYKNVKTDSLEI